MRTHLSHQRLLALIDLAYGAADDPATWGGFLTHLADNVGARTAVMLWHDLENAGGVSIGARNDPDAARQYQEHYCRIDPRALSPRAFTLAVPGQPVTDEMLVPYEKVRKTAYHHEFSSRYGISRLMTVALKREGALFEGISLLRSHEDGPFGAPELAFLKAVTPHVQRAMRLSMTFTTLRSERDAFSEGVDRLTLGLVFVDRDGKIVLANKSALRLLTAHDGLRDDRGIICAADNRTTSRLRALCRQCHETTHASGVSPGGWLHVERPSGKRPLQVLVSPINAQQRVAINQRQIAAIVFVSDPELVPESPSRLRELFDLTPAELAVATLIARGYGTEQLADALSYTRETSRWYVKALLQKTGCRSRTELASLLAGTLGQVEAG